MHACMHRAREKEEEEEKEARNPPPTNGATAGERPLVAWMGNVGPTSGPERKEEKYNNK